MSDAVTREETLLNAIATGEAVDIVPVTRKEKYLRYLAGIGEKPSKPITREEMFLDKIQAGGSGGGEEEASLLDSLIDRTITEVSSNAESVPQYMFNKCTALTTADFPLATTIGAYAFQFCTRLTSITAPQATSVSNQAFNDCDSLVSVNLPEVTELGAGVFRGCEALEKVVFPKVTDAGLTVFSKSPKLKIADFSKLVTIQQQTFYNCFSFTTLILRNDTMTTLTNIDTFIGTKIYSQTGYIYVPSSLIEEYKVATNWSAFSTQFRALEDYTVDGTITGELDESKI